MLDGSAAVQLCEWVCVMTASKQSEKSKARVWEWSEGGRERGAEGGGEKKKRPFVVPI